MKWKRIPFWVLAFCIVWFMVLGTPSAMADGGPVASCGSFGNCLSTGDYGPKEFAPIQDYFQSAASGLVDSATRLFFLLITLDIFWMSAQFLLTRDNLGEFLAQVFLKAVTFSFIYGVVILNGQAITSTIIQSFIQAGSKNPVTPDPALLLTEGILAALPAFAAGLIADAIPDEVLGTGDPELFQALGEFCMVGGMFVLLGYVAIAGELILVFTEAYIVTSLGILVTGFYGSRWTQQYAEKYLSYAINVGVKLFVTYVVVGAIQDIVFPASLVLLIGVPPANFVVFGIVQCMTAVIAYSVPQFAAALVSGTSSASSDKLVQGVSSAVSTGMKAISKANTSENRMTARDMRRDEARQSASDQSTSSGLQSRTNEAALAYFSRPTASFDAPNGPGAAAAGAPGASGAAGSDGARSSVTIGQRGATGQAGPPATTGAGASATALSNGGQPPTPSWVSATSPGANRAAASAPPAAASIPAAARNDVFSSASATAGGLGAGGARPLQVPATPPPGGVPLGGSSNSVAGTVQGASSAQLLPGGADTLDRALAPPAAPPQTIFSSVEPPAAPSLPGGTGASAGPAAAAGPAQAAPAASPVTSSSPASLSAASSSPGSASEALRLAQVPQTPLGAVVAATGGSGAQSGASSYGGGSSGETVQAGVVNKLSADTQKLAHDMVDLKNSLPSASKQPGSATTESRAVDIP